MRNPFRRHDRETRVGAVHAAILIAIPTVALAATGGMIFDALTSSSTEVTSFTCWEVDIFPATQNVAHSDDLDYIENNYPELDWYAETVTAPDPKHAPGIVHGPCIGDHTAY